MRRVAILFLVVALGLAWWATAERPAPRIPPRPAAVPGIVVVCLDTLRADAVEPSPGSAGLPSLAAFGASATRFSGALAACSWTGPSVATLLTGLAPWDHGVFEVATGTRLAASVPTVATALARAGWSTAAVTGGGWLSEGCGLPAGFQQYDVDFDEHRPRDVVERWQARRPTDRPFFLFLHTYAAHDPYGDKEAPRARACADDVAARGEALVARLRAAPLDADPALLHDYVRVRFTDPCERQVLMRGLSPARFEALYATCRAWIDGGWRDAPGGPAMVERMRAAYVGPGYAYVDARLRETLAALAALPPETVVVVCSDHGEAFGEHGPLYHGRYLVPELTRVLLYVRAPGLPAGATIAAPVGLVDVTPTLLAWAGVPALRTPDGADLVAVAKGTAPPRAVVSVVSPPPAPDGSGETWVRRACVRDATTTWEGRFDVRKGAWVEERWFDRRHDPDEQRPAQAVAAPPSPEVAAGVAAARAAFARLYGRGG